jgi:N-acyl-D-amino-acid deacylase
MTLLIRNVRIVGTSRKFPERSDVFVQGERISAIGNFPAKKADEMIDGQGIYLAPGFIDVNTDSDHYLTLFDNPAQEDFLKQGVTTIMGGMCGASLAPLLYGDLESVRKWGDIRCVNVGWHTMAEFLHILEGRGLGVNFGTLAGHSTIRHALSGAEQRHLTKNELGVFSATLARALEEGAFGLSSGLGYAESHEVSYAELRALVGIVRAHHGLYSTHVRNSADGLAESVEETLKLRRDAGVPTLISHFMPFKGSEKAYAEVLEKMREVPDARAVYFDIYPFDMSVVPLSTLLPAWAQDGNAEAMVQNLADAWKRKRVLKELAEYGDTDVVVAAAPYNPTLVGKSLGNIKALYSAPTGAEALLALMRITELRAVVFCQNIAAELIHGALTHPRSLIATNAASVRESSRLTLLKPERAARTFPKFLETVNAQKLMPLDEAIVKITKTPASLFGIADRGEVKEGNYADLVGFTFREGGSAALEIRFVAVNGALAVQNDVSKGLLKGKVLRHRA